MNYVLRIAKASGTTQKHRAAKLLPAGQLKFVLLKLKLVKALTLR